MFVEATVAFKMHSYVGNWWQAQLKSDAALKAEYDSLGKDAKCKKSLREKKIHAKLEQLTEEYIEEIEEGGARDAGSLFTA